MTTFFPNRISICGLLFVLLYFLLSSLARAAAGDLDPAFGSGGVVTTHFGGSSRDYAASVALQSDGKIVVAGGSSVSPIGGIDNFAVARYTAAGALDTSFNGTGKVVTPVGSGSSGAASVAIQSDGKIIVAGYSSNGANNDFTVLRYTSDGALDTTFGGTGIVTTPIGSGSDVARSVALQSDGKIVAAGSSSDSSNGSNGSFAVVRYTTAGVLDTDFNGTGKVVTPIGSGSSGASGVALQSDGKIVVAGSWNNGGNYDFAVVRYTTAGGLDTDFNGSGKVTTSFGSATTDLASSVAIQGDGKIVVAGYSRYVINTPVGGSHSDFAVARFSPTGALDYLVVTPVGSGDNQASSVAIQSDGKTVVAGSSYVNNGDVALVRYTAVGALDTGFNGTGKVITSIGSGSDYASSVAIQADGKIVVAGRASVLGTDDFAVMRFEAEPGPLPPGVTTGEADGVSATSATLHGTVNPHGLATTVEIQYGLTTSYGSTAGAILSPNSGTSAQSVSTTLGGLTANTLYHWRVAATNAGGTIYGSDATFYTGAGSLDVSFGNRGKVTTDMSEAFSLAIQSDGKIVVAGYTGAGSYPNQYSVFGLVRYTSFGGIDTTFGGGTGKVTVDFGYTKESHANSVAFQSDGKILVAGDAADTFWTNTSFALARLNSTGQLDSTFGTYGKVATPIGSGFDVGQSIAVQSDGKIVVAGWSDDGGNNDFALIRYTTTGALDTSFNGTGKVVTPIGSGSDLGMSVAVQNDGKIVVAGRSFNGSNDDFALARYTTTGVLDTSFNGTGKVTTPIGNGSDFAYSVALQGDGKIVVAGWSDDGGNYAFALARYTDAGTLDTSFNGTGKATTRIGDRNSYGYSAAIQSDGKIVVAGTFQGTRNNDFALVRYTSAGGLDTTFNGTGKAATDFGGNDFGQGVALQNDGNIVVAGRSDGAGKGFAVARYLGRSPNDDDRDGLLDSWEVDHFGSTAAHTALDDTDFDGRVELMEEAFGSDPLIPDVGLLVQAVNEGGYLTITLTRHAGITYVIQSAGTPDSPAFSGATTTVLIDDGTTLKACDNVLITSPGQRYMRVLVTASP